MNEPEWKNMSIASWEDHIIGRDDLKCRKNFDFRLQKRWIDSIVDELEINLKLFFRVFTGVQHLKFKHRNELNVEISKLVHLEVDELIIRLNEIQMNYRIGCIEIPDKYLPVLKTVKHLRSMLPIKQEVLLPYKRKRTEEEKLQWITGILGSKAKIRNLRRKIRTMQSAIDETKLELFMLNERSPREIQDLIDQSELELIDLKQNCDRQFARLQEEAANKVLDIDQNNEYRDLTNEHNIKRRKITKLTVQLQLWIKQYDKFVGEPAKELEALEKEVDQFPEWKETVYDIQEERFNQLKFNVDLLESELIEEQVERFRIEHAARVLQRAWRKLLDNKKLKKKKKKNKKKGKKSKAKKNI